VVDDGLDATAGENIRRLRGALGMSQAELAGLLGATYRQQTVHKVEQGTRPLRLAEAAAIAEVFHVRVDDLYAGEYEGNRVAQLEGVARMVIDRYRAAADALTVLEDRRRTLAGMLQKMETVPPRLREVAESWADDTLIEQCAEEGKRRVDELYAPGAPLRAPVEGG